MTLEEIKQRIVENYDPDLLVEILEITSEEILEAFDDKLEEKLYKFEGELEDEGD